MYFKERTPTFEHFLSCNFSPHVTFTPTGAFEKLT